MVRGVETMHSAARRVLMFIVESRSAVMFGQHVSAVRGCCHYLERMYRIIFSAIVLE